MRSGIPSRGRTRSPIVPVAVTLLGEPLVVVRHPSGNGGGVRRRVPTPRCTVEPRPSRGRRARLRVSTAGASGRDGAATCIPALGRTRRSRRGRGCSSRQDVCERYGIVWVALEPPRSPIVDGRTETTTVSASSADRPHQRGAGRVPDRQPARRQPLPVPAQLVEHRNPLIGEQEIVDQHDLGFSTVQRKLADDNESTEGWLRYTLRRAVHRPVAQRGAGRRLRNSFFQAIQPIDERRTRLFFHRPRAARPTRRCWQSCWPRRRSCSRRTCGSLRRCDARACRWCRAPTCTCVPTGTRSCIAV